MTVTVPSLSIQTIYATSQPNLTERQFTIPAGGGGSDVHSAAAALEYGCQTLVLALILVWLFGLVISRRT